MEDDETSLALTGVYSGLSVAFGTSTSIAARAGYSIAAEEDGEGLRYTQVTIVTDQEAAEPPSLVFSADYAQQVDISELDLDLRYTDLPEDSAVEVTCSEKRFDIARQKVGGTGLVGSSGKNLGDFTMSIEVRLWIPQGAEIKPGAALSMNLSKIKGGTGKPVQKVLLQKLAINLSAKI